jgi:hypothetical protein
MLEKKAKKESGEALLLDIMKEMAKSRKAKSARDGEVKIIAAVRIKRSKQGKTKL